MRVAERLRRELAELERRSQLRSLELAPALDFSSNDYLGLAVDPRLKQAVAGALAGAEPAAATGSRLLSGHSERWNELESDFARWIGAEAALFFTSGYLANIGLLAAILAPEDTVFSDSANHASLIDGIRLSKARRVVFPHLDLNFLEDALRSEPATGARFIVVESVFSMEGDRAPLAERTLLESLAPTVGLDTVLADLEPQDPRALHLVGLLLIRDDEQARFLGPRVAPGEHAFEG